MDTVATKILAKAVHPTTPDNEALNAFRLFHQRVDVLRRPTLRRPLEASRTADLIRTIQTLHREIAKLQADLAKASDEIARLKAPPIHEIEAIRAAILESSTVVAALTALRWPIHNHSYRRLAQFAAQHGIPYDHLANGNGRRRPR